MEFREKVIRGLECCVRTIEDCECADNCPYETQCWDGTMYLDLMRDALALLREQEPVEPRWFTDVHHPAGAFVCGACRERIVEKNFDFYCPKCGKAVKWVD